MAGEIAEQIEAQKVNVTPRE